MRVTPSAVLASAVLALSMMPARGSELSYTFMDFQVVDDSVDAMGTQIPVPGQVVDVTTREGEGISVGGSMAVGERFYLGGSFSSSIIDVDGVVTSPLIVTNVTDDFDLIRTQLSLGYLIVVGETFDLIAEVSLDSTEYDFGSFAGESFDIDDAGAGAKVGFRWNPSPRFELYAFGKYSSVGDVNLSLLEFENESSANVGVRWYVFEDLAFGFEVESGQVETATFSMRFGFGDLPW